MFISNQRKQLERAEQKLLEAMREAGVVDPDSSIKILAQYRSNRAMNIRGAEQDLQRYQAQLEALVEEHEQLSGAEEDETSLLLNASRLELAENIEDARERVTKAFPCFPFL